MHRGSKKGITGKSVFMFRKKQQVLYCRLLNKDGDKKNNQGFSLVGNKNKKGK